MRNEEILGRSAEILVGNMEEPNDIYKLGKFHETGFMTDENGKPSREMFMKMLMYLISSGRQLSYSFDDKSGWYQITES
jgi:hypothetical protein